MATAGDEAAAAKVETVMVPRDGPPTAAFEITADGRCIERQLVTEDGKPSDSCGNAIEERAHKPKGKRRGKKKSKA